MMSTLCVHHLIEVQAARTAGAAAIISRDGVLSYRRLNDRADELAARLGALSVQPEVRVGLAVEQSSHGLVTLLAIWTAGCVYVPLELSLPAGVIAAMVINAELELVLRSGPEQMPDGIASSVVDLADLNPQGLAAPVTGSASAMWPANLAYCIFTSGPTGRPKPVRAAHTSLARHATSIRTELGLRPTDQVLQYTSMSLDASLEEVLPPWLAGAAVVQPEAPRPTSVELTEQITARGVTVVSLPGAYWHQWVDDLVASVVSLPDDLRTVFVRGNKMRLDKLVLWSKVDRSRSVDWIADYGPTETTISATVYRPDPTNLPDTGLVPIGRPMLGATVHLLDDELAPVADGDPGEVWIAGPRLAREYLGAPSATADRFWPDPFGPPGARMYRTGDRASLLPDGNLQRFDQSSRQVKIRAYRVEPGQVENAAGARTPPTPRSLNRPQAWRRCARSWPTGFRPSCSHRPSCGWTVFRGPGWKRPSLSSWLRAPRRRHTGAGTGRSSTTATHRWSSRIGPGQ